MNDSCGSRQRSDWSVVGGGQSSRLPDERAGREQFGRSGRAVRAGRRLIATNSPSPPHKVCMRAVAYPEQQDIGTKPQQQIARDNSTKNPWLYGYLVHTLRLVHNQVFYSRCLNCSTFLLRFLSCFCTLILAILRKLTNTASVTVRNCIV